MKSFLSGFAVLILLSSCGGGGGGGGGDSQPPVPTTPAPSVSLSAEPTSVLLESTSTLTWSSSNTTSCSASWTSQTSTSGSEAVTISTAGSNSFSISCSGAGGSGSASVTVEGYRETDGVVVDGYISGAEVCIDENESWTCDSNENSTTSDNEGKFTIRYANGNLVSIGGTDLDSQTLLDNLLITHKLSGHSDFKAVTPVTSVAAFMEDASLVNAALGIDSSIDVFTFDPVANKGDGGINDYLYEKGNQLTVLAFALQNISNNLNSTTETTQDYFEAITEEIEKEYTDTQTKVDIETQAFVTKALDNVIAAKSVTIDETAKANVTKALSGMLPIIQVKSSDDLTTSVIRFAVSTLQTDIQAIANGTATAETVTSYTEDLLTYIAEDQNVDSGEIAPDISAIADTATTSEDTEVEINVLLNDSYVTSSPFSLSATNGTKGSTSISNNVITYSPDADYNGTDTFSYTLTQGEKTSSADVTLIIEAVNDAPTIDIALTIQVQENQTAVTTVSVSDVDEDELTLTLGGADADSFNLSSENVLTFKEAPDYETKNSYSITLSLTDGTEVVTKDVTITIIDINDAAPVFTSESTFSAAENQTAIGTVTATDPEGDSFSFSISGTELSITSEGVLSFTSAPDYETRATYTATVTVVDTEDNSATQDITINVTNVNDNSPVFTSNATFSVEENKTAIGTVTATDADGDAATFSISGTELEITSAGILSFISAPDYETKTTYTATVTASDGTNTTTQDITINVTNVNDVAPEFTSEATFSPDENQTSIGTVSATDAEGDDVTLTVSGSELAITSAGVLTFVSAPDYETKATYTATVTASDGSNSTTQDITINVTNLNDNSPVITSSNEYSIEENTTEIGQATATDDDGDGIAFSITSDSDISIDSSSGVIYFNTAPDYETATSHSATITLSDGAFTSSQAITINVTDADEGPPELIDLEINGFGSNSDTDFKYSSTQIKFTVTDETAISKIVLKLQNTDTESFYENIQNYTLTDGGNSEGRLEDAWSIAFKNKLRSGTYKITELALYDTLDKSVNAVIDTNFDTSFEVTNSNQEVVAPELLAHTLTINDNVLTVHALIKEEDSKIAKTRHRGVDGNASSTEIDEAGYYINVRASDTSISYVGDIVDSSDLIDNEDGTFNVVTRHDMSSNVDAEASEIILYEIHDTAFNRTEYLQNSSLKPVPDPNADPIFISDSTFSVDENETGIGTASARNAKGDALTYSVSGSEVIINETSGVMVFASAPDYESKSTYTVTVTATDGTNPSTQEITININDVREQTIQVTVEANNNGSGNVYVINGTQKPNLDLVKGVTYTFVHPTAHPFRFSTTANGTHGGGVEYTTGVNAGSSGTTIIKVTDNTPEDLYYYCSVHSGMGNGINLIDNAPPEFTSSATFSADENQTAIGTVTAADAEGDAITYSISGSDIEITSAGVLSFVVAPDYETKSLYSATITANDGTSSSTQDITVNINNLNDNNPSFSSNATFSVEENKTAIGTVTATDADGDGITLTISGSEIEVTSEGVLTFTNAPDYEDKTSYTAVITASDGANTSTQEITVNITNVNDESPEFTSNATFSAEENQTSIETVTATDADGDSVTFTISGSDISITSSGVLSFVNTPDYETQSAYSATVTASDGTYTSDQDITVNITNVNDNSPSFTSNATFSAEENQTAIGTASATDADGDGITYSISGSDITINASSGVLEFVSAPDYETTTSYTAIITAVDGTFSTTQDVTVNIENIPNVSGLAYTSRYSVMDSDIPNTDYLAYTSNDTVSDAQTLINPSVVTGYIGESDTIDVYKVSTSSSMFVNLDVVDYENDSKELRIYLYDSDGSARDFSYTSASTEANLTILLPNGGDYLIAVRQENNNSQYVLTLGQRYTSSTAEVSTDFIPEYDEDIRFAGYVPQEKQLSRTSDSSSRDTIAAVELDKNELFDLTGFYFDEPGVKGFNIKKTDQLNIKPKPSIDDNNSGLEPISQKQQDYLNYWSQLQYLRSLNSNAIFDFNYTYRTSSFTKDPLYQYQWNLDRVGLEPTLNALGQDVKDVAVAVIDSGGPTPNSEAWNESNLIDGGYDFVYGYSNSVDYLATSNYTGNKTSHGTHVSTTIAAKNNGSFINGYAVKALNINVFDVVGSGADAKTGRAASVHTTNAILYASGLSNTSGSVAPNTTPIKVINLSLGGPSYDAVQCAAINDAISQGITVVAAAGNEQDEQPGLISYPASCPGAISVGATNSGGGITSYSNQNVHVDISAPGGDASDRDGDGTSDAIVAFGNDSFDPNRALAAGTSMASPQVAAAIALMYSVDNSLTPSRVENMLIAGELTNDKGDSGRDDVFGYGELNLPKAIENLFDDISNTTTYAYTSVPFLDFDDSKTQITLDLLKVGDGALSVSSLTADNASGLTYDDSSSGSNGFGTYTIFIDRSSIPNGEFSNTIYFNLSSGDQVAIKIYYIVGSLRERANIGKAYIAMYDASDDSLWGSLETEVDGSVSFVANDVAPGNYYILTSTDIDNDNSVCDYGELCEYYPEYGETTYYFTVSDSNLSGYEIFLQPIIKYGGVNAASTGNEVNQLNNSKSPSRPKQINGLRKILINPIGPNKESIKDDIGVKGDKKFNTN